MLCLVNRVQVSWKFIFLLLSSLSLLSPISIMSAMKMEVLSLPLDSIIVIKINIKYTRALKKCDEAV